MIFQHTVDQSQTPHYREWKPPIGATERIRLTIAQGRKNRDEDIHFRREACAFNNELRAVSFRVIEH